MRALFFAVLLWFSSATFADGKIEFNGQVFYLKSGYCMTVYAGESCYTWQIVGYSNAAEQEIAKKISDKIAYQSCENWSVNCWRYAQYCF